MNPIAGLHDERGMTLTELLIGMLILGIVLAASLPGFRSMMYGHRHNASVGQVTSRIFLTRQMAVRDRTPYTMLLDLVNSRYSVFQDNDGDGVFDAGETALGPWSLNTDVVLQNVSWAGDKMTFFANGSASQTGDIRIVDTRGHTKTLRVSSITGNVEVLP
ncbi:MAG TPA: GspH/FimT family pseudopilin [bacterium]|nr:GspH/FimT family pseudopilin [bacterium]